MSMNAEYVAKMEMQLKQWDADVASLIAEADRASTQARVAYDERMKALRESRDAAQKTFREISTANESTAAQIKAGMDSAWNTMQKTLIRVSSDIRTRPSTRSA